jgi:hypothetical protein
MHSPTLLTTRVTVRPIARGRRTFRRAFWSTCTCGWTSEKHYTTVTGAHYAFGTHLVEQQ